MKAKIFFITLLFIAFSFSSCGIIGSSTSSSSSNSNSQAYTSGQGFGTALTALYRQYKTDGKVDFSNTNNLLNMASLATYGLQIKGQSKTSDFYKQFASGIISGSSNLVTNNTVGNIISSVTNLDLSSISNAISNNGTSSNTTLTNTAATALVNVFSLLNK